MSGDLQNIIKSQNDKINNLSSRKKPKYTKSEIPQKKRIIIPWCKKCHFNPRILPLEERIQISKKKEYRFKRYKTCNNNYFLYCIKIIQKLNKKIEPHNQRVQEKKGATSKPHKWRYRNDRIAKRRKKKLSISKRAKDKKLYKN